MFFMTLNYKFRDTEYQLTGNIKQNLARIAHKIDLKRVKAKLEKDNTFRVYDMVRATVVV